MKTILLLALLATTGCATVPPQATAQASKPSFGECLGRGLVRLATEDTYTTPYGQFRDSRVEGQIFGSRTK